MDDHEFDAALVAAAFEQAGLTGWRELSIVEAARSAGLPLDRARARFPGPPAVLMRFGVIADQAALAETANEPIVRDRLFDLLMRRFDVLQQHRAGMLALLPVLPAMPLMALALSGATFRSMGWMLEAADVSAQGLAGRTKVAGLVGVWLYALRAWQSDESADLAGTMAALDKALDQAERLSSYLSGSAAGSPSSPDLPEPTMPDPSATEPLEPAALPPPSVVEIPDPTFPPPPPPPEPPPSPV